MATPMYLKAEIDVVPYNDDSNAETVRKLRQEINPLSIHVTVIEMVDPNGNVSVRLSSLSRKKLRKWLDDSGYEDTEIENPLPNLVPKTRK